MGGDPAAPITPSQIGIPLLISKNKNKDVCPLQCGGSWLQGPHSCAAMLLQNMQSDDYCTVLWLQYGVHWEKSTGSPGAGCSSQLAAHRCMEPSSHGG